MKLYEDDDGFALIAKENIYLTDFIGLTRRSFSKSQHINLYNPRQITFLELYTRKAELNDFLDQVKEYINKDVE